MISHAEALRLAHSVVDYRTRAHAEAAQLLAKYVIAQEPLHEQLGSVLERVVDLDARQRYDEVRVLVKLAVDTFTQMRGAT